jgi:6-phosphogluconolactonase (cycloisomerase 2 family)
MFIIRKRWRIAARYARGTVRKAAIKVIKNGRFLYTRGNKLVKNA